MLAMMAGNAVAADVLEAGTAEAPKYYVIKANRGLPYVTYTAEAKNNGGAETHLYRANALSEAAVWAVVPGSVDGTVNIYNYTTKDSEDKAYIINYVTKDGSEFVGGQDSGTATTGEAQDVYVMNNGNGSYGLALKCLNGYNGAFWGLDATQNSEFLGNWYSCGDAGTQWWCYRVDVSNGVEAGLEGVNKAFLKEEMDPVIASYKGYFQDYMEAVPYVQTELQEGIDALDQLEPTADYNTQINNIWGQYTNKANAKLNTMFDGKEVAFQNVRRETNGNAKPYISVGETNYPMTENYATDPAAVFILESTTYDEDVPSYYMYNAETQKYYGANNVPVDTKEEATSIRFILQSDSGFIGVNILANGISGDQNGLNADPNGNPLTYWYPADGGSIWKIIEYTNDKALSEAISGVKTALEPYIPNMPEDIAEVLQAAVNEATKLEYSADVASKANAILTNALADANNYLKNNLGGKNWALKSLRNGYVDVAAGQTLVETISSQESANSVYEFIKVEDGGYKIYNQVAKSFFGPYVKKTEDSNETYVSLVSNYADAIKVYPVLNHSGSFYGISFALTDGGNRGFNTNDHGLHEYGINDGGSIFTITYKGKPTTEIVEVEKAEGASEGIYDLSGRKLSAPVRGINIINGKKVLVK